MDFTLLSQRTAMEPKRLEEVLKGLAHCDRIERRTDNRGRINQLVVLKKDYRLYFKFIFSIILTILIIYFVGPNIKVLNLSGLTFGIAGAIFLTIGSFDNFKPIIDSKEHRPLRVGLKDIKLLYKKDYNHISTMVGMPYVGYPALRLITAEFGPWLLLIGFALQFYAVYMSP